MKKGCRDGRLTDGTPQAVDPGLYQLRVHLEQPATICVGALGDCRFPAGWYVYTGSARSGLHQRISRHLRHKKRRHWHIDHLLARADHVEAFVLPEAAVTECEQHAALTGGEVVVPGFGSSDCGCRSHLVWFRRRPGIGLMPWGEFTR